jgi:hypothetical protein
LILFIFNPVFTFILVSRTTNSLQNMTEKISAAVSAAVSADVSAAVPKTSKDLYEAYSTDCGRETDKILTTRELPVDKPKAWVSPAEMSAALHFENLNKLIGKDLRLMGLIVAKLEKKFSQLTEAYLAHKDTSTVGHPLICQYNLMILETSCSSLKKVIATYEAVDWVKELLSRDD